MAGRPFKRAGGWGTHSAATYRSGLEDKIAGQLESKSVPVVFEQFDIKYVIPASDHKYTPDFVLPNGIIIEGKGIFDADDRKKHLLIREQHPELDIRFVFSSSKALLYKGSPTSYAKWCEKYGFKFADKLIPDAWLREPGTGRSLVSLNRKKKKEA
ncbi:endonuclease I [Ralstonia phage p2106]|uniref:Endonuclease I n=1 Tax=Ralstonia phage p2106 TaxID=2998497 RepID=A0AAE9VL89_9CAUD|nr:endonuclease I [Ralstonia phage p2106]